jgi:hypothetical protein
MKESKLEKKFSKMQKKLDSINPKAVLKARDIRKRMDNMLKKMEKSR